MDIYKMDPPGTSKRNSNVDRKLEVLEGKINILDKNISEDKKSNAMLRNSITDIENQMKSIMLINEDILVKLHASSKKEAEHDNLIKKLVEERKSKSEDDEILNIVKEFKTNMNHLVTKYNNIERRMQALETAKLPIIKDDIVKIKKPKENDNGIYVILKFDDKNNKNLLDQIIKGKNETCQLFVSKDNDEEFKVYDIEWFSKNLFILTDMCSEITLNNVEALDIIEDIIFSKDMIFTATPKTDLHFRNNSSINISANVTFNNINLIECHFEDKFLICVKESHKLEYNNGYIEKNLGFPSLFGVSTNSTLSLNKTVFDNNIQLEDHGKSCIMTGNGANVYIDNCEFINHASKDCPYSTGLFSVNGNLTITSTKFENNKIEVEKWINFGCQNGDVIMDDVKFKDCSSIGLVNCKSVNIKKSIFIDNSTVTDSRGCLMIENCENVIIDECVFTNNKNENYTGALFLNSCKGENLIKNSLFQENSSINSIGGAVFIANAEMKFENVNFNKNSSKKISGAIFANSSKITCGYCTFKSNTAGELGGAICLLKSEFIQATPNKFISNSAPTYNDILDIDKMPS